MSTDLRFLSKTPAGNMHILAPQIDNYFHGHGDRWFSLQVFLNDEL